MPRRRSPCSATGSLPTLSAEWTWTCAFRGSPSTENGALAGIVDWVDVCRSDAAVDLSVAWSTLSTDERRVFFAAYGDVADDVRIRARVVAAFLCATLADWAAKERVPDVLDAASAGLRRAIEDD